MAARLGRRDFDTARQRHGTCEHPMSRSSHQPDVREGDAATPVDVVVVGAGPAGLSAALILGRCLRRVVVIDAGRPRNAASRAMHGFLTRDGIPPHDLLRIGREQLASYETVRLERGEVVEARCRGTSFDVRLGDGRCYESRKLLLATGVVDEIPPLEGIAALYGRSVFHCPYCDGWEFRQQPVAVYGRGRSGLGLALELKGWTSDLVLCTDAPARLSSRQRQLLSDHEIGLRESRIARLEGTDGQLSHVVFAGGERMARRALFFSAGQAQGSRLAAMLGCQFTRKGAVQTGDYEATSIPGLFVAGDASRLVQLAIVAAAEGAKAGFAINQALLREAGLTVDGGVRS
jgi:thioredoxin reductase